MGILHLICNVRYHGAIGPLYLSSYAYRYICLNAESNSIVAICVKVFKGQIAYIRLATEVFSRPYNFLVGFTQAYGV